MKILRSPGLYTEAELQGLEWLGTRGKWLTVRVRRRSPREFDLEIEGELDADDGFDTAFEPPVHEPLVPGGPAVETVQGHRTPRGYAKVKPMRFSAWFVLAALSEFWGMGLHSPEHGDWSFTRDMEQEEQWAEFNRILELRRAQLAAAGDAPASQGLPQQAVPAA